LSAVNFIFIIPILNDEATMHQGSILVFKQKDMLFI